MKTAIKCWGELSAAEIDAMLARSEADIAAGRTCSQSELDAILKDRLHHAAAEQSRDSQ